MKKLLLLLLVPIAGLLWWGIARKNEPPGVGFARVRRDTLVSTLPTNGKAEPFQWQAVHAETSGLVESVAVREGQSVKKGDPLATVANPALETEARVAEAKVAEARANLAALESGGKPLELADIANSLARARLDLEEAQRNYAALTRLEKKQAATAFETQTAQSKVRQLELEIESLEKRRPALVSRPEVEAAAARLQDAEAALELARRRIVLTVLRAPIPGAVYQLPVRPGAYLEAGGLVAEIGTLDRLRVRVYVDEPELGRVQEGQPVTITWDALPGRQWQGKVERRPTAIQTLGTRQVGEVVCEIENPGRDLIPGTNVNAELRTAVAPGALVLPKESLRRDAQGVFVFVLKDGAIERRLVKTGVSSISLVQAVEGLSEGDAVAMPSDVALQPGLRVTPSYQ